MSMILILILFVVICIVVYIVMNRKLDKNYYDVSEIEPHLDQIYPKMNIYKDEINKIKNNPTWFSWVEKSLYDKGEWKVIPFCGFGIWDKQNCDLCPELTRFLKSIPNLKLAILSRLGAKTKLNEHCGWANHANNVLRCHFGFEIPDGCYLSVNKEIRKYKQDKWIIFDDSRPHFSHNQSGNDRIVLLLDIARPKNVVQGNAVKGDSNELVELIKFFTNKNK